MLLQTMRFVSFSLILALSGCAGVARPDIDIVIVNAPGKRAKGYNMKDDYDNDGVLKPGAVPKYYPAEKIEDLNKWYCINSKDGPVQAGARMSAYLKKVREEIKNGCKPPN